jgi:hypothetical protein
VPRPAEIPEDRELSPYTGWTRAHWEAAADTLLAGVAGHATAGGALYDLPGPRPAAAGRRSDGYEGFARTFLLAAFRIPHAPPPVRDALVARYSAGLAEGTRPGSPGAWPRMTDNSQPIVESASVALGLYLTTAWLWDLLPEEVRANTVDYLGDIVGTRPADCNWLWFKVIILAFLESVGGPAEPGWSGKALHRIDGWYRGDGWYTDGGDATSTKFDHYTGWAFHFYGSLWSVLAGDRTDPARARVHRRRAAGHVRELVHLVGADGGPLHQGRSLTYRMAAAAPLWATEVAGAGGIAPGLTRRAASGILRHFADRGLLDGDVLPLGWYDEHLPSVQAYSGPASPYWASKAFCGLLLPPDHPAWTATEEPLPVERGDFTRALRAPGWLAQGTRADGIVRVLNHGTVRAPDERDPFVELRQDDPHYARFGYSTRTGPVTAGPGPVDNHVSLTGRDGAASHRGRSRLLALDADFVLSEQRPWHDGEGPAVFGAAGGARLRTFSLVNGAWELRGHLVTAAPGARVRVTGWALAGREVPRVRTGPGWCAIRREDGTSSAMVVLAGLNDPHAVRLEDANAFGPHAAMPAAEAELPLGEGVSEETWGASSLLLTALTLTGSPVDPEAFARELSVRSEDGVLVVRWPDGARHTVRPGADVPFLGQDRAEGEM